MSKFNINLGLRDKQNLSAENVASANAVLERMSRTASAKNPQDDAYAGLEGTEVPYSEELNNVLTRTVNRTKKDLPTDDLAQNPAVYAGTLNQINQAEDNLNTTDLGINPSSDIKGPFAEGANQSPEEALNTAAAGNLRTMETGEWVENFAPEWTGQSKALMHDQVESFLGYSAEVNKNAQKLSIGLTGPQRIAFSRNLAEENGLDPNSVGEYLNGFIVNYAHLQEKGVPQALTDIHMAAMLHVGMENKWMSAQTKEQRDVLQPGQVAVDYETELGASSRTDEKVGRLIHKTLGIQSDSKMDVIGGAIARKLVVDTHGGDKLWGVARIATSKRDDQGVQHTANVSVLTREGVAKAKSMRGLIETMIPSTLKEPRFTRTEEPANFVRPSKGDPKKDYGRFKFVNKTIDILDNTPGRASTLVANVLNIIQDTKAFQEEGFLNIKKDGKGGEKTVQLDEATGQYKPYKGNEIKRRAANNEIAFAFHMNNAFSYNDHFLGTNNRFYARGVHFNGASVGNYQATKSARAMLEGLPVEYNIDPNPAGNSKDGSNDLQNLKAGIMKKFGKPYSTTRYGVREAAMVFDKRVAYWAELMKDDAAIHQNKEEIAQEAIREFADEHNNKGEGEGYMAVSAMVEAVKLHQAMQVNKNRARAGQKALTYRSGFYTEIDGIANGIGHNTLQGGGSELIQRAVGLYSPKELAQVAKDVKDGIHNPDDVYELTTDGAIAALTSKGWNDERQAKVDAVLSLFTLDRGFGKKPMMIFGYGAREARILDAVGDWVDEQINKDPDLARAIADSGVINLEDVKQILGWGANSAVEETFTSVKLLNSFMQETAQVAINAGLEPWFTMREGHRINFGEFIDEIIPGAGIPISYREGQRRRDDMNVTAYPRFQGIQGKSNKSVTQAGVLPTHAQDGINIGTSFQNMERYFAKRGNARKGAGGHQVFDGIFMTPKDAPKWAKTLNDDFYDINKNFSFAQEFYDQLMTEAAFRNADKKKILGMLNEINTARRSVLGRISKEHIRQFYWDH